MNFKAARMISKSIDSSKRSNDVRAATEDGRITEDDTDCGACLQVETSKKKTPREKAKNDKKP